MNKTIIPSLGTALAFALSARAADEHAYKVDASKLPPASTQKGVTYAKDIQPILEKSCVKCHSGDKPKGGLRLDKLANVLKGGDDGKVVIPGKSADSPAVGFTSDLVPDSEMPPKKKRADFPALTKEQIGLLRAWIDQGAK